MSLRSPSLTHFPLSPGASARSRGCFARPRPSVRSPTHRSTTAHAIGVLDGRPAERIVRYAHALHPLTSSVTAHARRLYHAQRVGIVEQWQVQKARDPVGLHEMRLLRPARETDSDDR